jgi:hypothetical protein
MVTNGSCSPCHTFFPIPLLIPYNLTDTSTIFTDQTMARCPSIWPGIWMSPLVLVEGDETYSFPYQLLQPTCFRTSFSDSYPSFSSTITVSSCCVLLSLVRTTLFSWERDEQRQAYLILEQRKLEVMGIHKLEQFSSWILYGSDRLNFNAIRWWRRYHLR